MTSTAIKELSTMKEAVEANWNSLFQVCEQIKILRRRTLNQIHVPRAEWTSLRQLLHAPVSTRVWQRILGGITSCTNPRCLKVLPKYFEQNASKKPDGCDDYEKKLRRLNRSQQHLKYDVKYVQHLPTLHKDQDQSLQAAAKEWKKLINGTISYPLAFANQSFFTFHRDTVLIQEQLLQTFYLLWKNNNYPNYSPSQWKTRFNKSRLQEAALLRASEDKSARKAAANQARNLVKDRAIKNLQSSIKQTEATLDRVRKIQSRHLTTDGRMPLKLQRLRSRSTRMTTSSSGSNISSDGSSSSSDGNSSDASPDTSLWIAAQIAAAAVESGASVNDVTAKFLEHLNYAVSNGQEQQQLMHAAFLLRGNSNSVVVEDRKHVAHANHYLVKHAFDQDTSNLRTNPRDHDSELTDMFANDGNGGNGNGNGGNGGEGVENGLISHLPSIAQRELAQRKQNRTNLDVMASSFPPEDVNHLQQTFQQGRAKALEDEKKKVQTQRLLNTDFVRRCFGKTTSVMWDATIKKAVENLLEVVGVSGVSVPSAARAANLVDRPDLRTVVTSDGHVFRERRNFRGHMQSYLNTTVRDALFVKFKDQSEARLRGIARADATNITKGAKARLPIMMTAFFLDIGSSLGLGNDSFSQQIYAIGDVNDHVEYLREYVPGFFERLKTIFAEPFIVQQENGGASLTVHIDFVLFIADGRLLRDASGHLVNGWKFLNPYHSMPAIDVYKGNFSSWDNRNTVPVENQGDEPVHLYGSDMVASKFMHQATSHSHETLQRVRDKYGSIASSEFGVNPQPGLIDGLAEMEETLNDSWHGVVTGDSGTFHKVMFKIFHACGQAKKWVHHVSECCHLPMEYTTMNGTPDIRMDGGDRLSLDLRSPMLSTTVRQCATCGLLLDCTEIQRKIIHSLVQATHWIACAFSSPSKIVRDMMLPILRKIAFFRDELVALIASPEFGGATPTVVSNQIINSAFRLKEKYNECLANIDQERMENFFKHIKDFNRSQSNHGGGGTASTSIKAEVIINQLFRKSDQRTHDNEQSTTRNTVQRQRLFAEKMENIDSTYITYFQQRSRLHSSCVSCMVPCCSECLKYGCPACTTDRGGVGTPAAEGGFDNSSGSGAAAAPSSPTSRTNMRSAPRPFRSPAKMSKPPLKIANKRSSSDPSYGSQRDTTEVRQALRRRLAADRKATGKKKSHAFTQYSQRAEESMLHVQRENIIGRKRLHDEADIDLERPHKKRFEYYIANDVTRKEAQQQRVNKFNQDVRHYNLHCRAIGAAAPNMYGGSRIGQITFLRHGYCGPLGGGALVYDCTNQRFSMNLSIVPRQRIFHIEFTPRGSTPILRKSRFSLPFSILNLSTKVVKIGRSDTIYMWTFSFELKQPGIRMVYNKGGWKTMTSHVLNNEKMSISPQITVEIALPVEFTAYWEKVVSYHISFQNPILPIQIDRQQQKEVFDAAQDQTLVTDDDGLVSEATATKCHLSLFDSRTAAAVQAQAIDFVIPRFLQSINQPLTRSYLKRCPCGKNVFVNQNGRVVLWDNETELHEFCKEACFYRMPGGQ